MILSSQALTTWDHKEISNTPSGLNSTSSQGVGCCRSRHCDISLGGMSRLGVVTGDSEHRGWGSIFKNTGLGGLQKLNCSQPPSAKCKHFQCAPRWGGALPGYWQHWHPSPVLRPGETCAKNLPHRRPRGKGRLLTCGSEHKEAEQGARAQEFVSAASLRSCAALGYSPPSLGLRLLPGK